MSTEAAENLHAESSINWIELIGSKVVSLLNYSFAKRHGRVALCERDQAIDIICLRSSEMEIYAELKRKLNGQLRIHEVNQAGFG